MHEEASSHSLKIKQLVSCRPRFKPSQFEVRVRGLQCTVVSTRYENLLPGPSRCLLLPSVLVAAYYFLGHIVVLVNQGLLDWGGAHGSGTVMEPYSSRAESRVQFYVQFYGHELVNELQLPPL